MKARKIINLILIQFVVVVMIGCANAPIYKSAYQNTKFNADNLNKEWPGLSLSDSDLGLVYGMTNDNENVYVKLKVVDQQIQRKILMNGLTLWFDKEAKAKKMLGFAFPLINENARQEASLPAMEGNDLALREKLQSIQLEKEKVNKRFTSGEESINVVSEKGEVVETIPSNRNEDGINIMVYMDEYHILYYEARIPIGKIFGEASERFKMDGLAFSYGFEVGELDLGVTYQRYLRSVSSVRSSQMYNTNQMYGGGMYGSNARYGGQDMYGVMKMRRKAIQIWVKKASLSTK